ncbi:FecR family protein [Pedobacter africanus]|uniref:FecR family protein n=1 Tax=Pedobacter africanus TaxID=151894 RepID=A0A1W2DL15_9SPHI|nr:FecR family protein [Pedobacter africanus]SMC98131.1 FecR family protein [Pedobacter africanus]
MTSKKNFDKSRVRGLLLAYTGNNIPYADYNELMDYIQEAKHDAELYVFMEQVWNAQPVLQPFTDLESKVLYQQILSDKRFKEKPKNKVPVYKMWYGIAASLVLLTIAATLVYNYKGFFKEEEALLSKNVIKNDIPPGSPKAILTLGDGSRVELSQAGNDSLMKNSDHITKAADGQLVYGHSVKMASLRYNTIETPRGGQYQVILPDGTKVWLNNASRLKYPEGFAGQHKRMVELTGEAYFEVAHNKKQPFVVKTDKQDVEVLGTHFNINSYTEENETMTTLLEGAVKVIKKQDKDQQQSLTLVPGQQSVLMAGVLSVRAVDLEAVMAWKNGYFIFKDESLRSIMRKISRWYDVDVTYAGNVPDKSYEGTISRFKNVSELLRKFELTEGVHFKVEGRRITVMP